MEAASQKPHLKKKNTKRFANMELSPQAKLLSISMYRHHVVNPNLNENKKRSARFPRALLHWNNCKSFIVINKTKVEFRGPSKKIPFLHYTLHSKGIA